MTAFLLNPRVGEVARTQDAILYRRLTDMSTENLQSGRQPGSRILGGPYQNQIFTNRAREIPSRQIRIGITIYRYL